MKLQFHFLVLCLIIVLRCHAEIFIGSTNAVNNIVIATNETIIISAARQAANYYTNDFPGLQSEVQVEINSSISGAININGSAHTFEFDALQDKPMAIAGPATLTFPANPPTNSLPVMIAFERLEGAGITSVYVATNSSATINVPSGKTCHLFAPICENNSGEPMLYLSVQATNGYLPNLAFFGEEEYTGPASLTISNSPSMYSLNGSNDAGDGAIVTYYFNENSIVLPSSGLLAGPTGSFQIVVQKSANLINWVPVVINNTSSDQKAFYRIQISR